MGMGYGANMELIIGLDSLENIVPNEMKALLDLIDSADSSLDSLATSTFYDDVMEDVTEEEDKAIQEAFTVMTDAFKSRTGIDLSLGHHDSDGDGSRYDEVDGAYFALKWSDVYELTTQAIALRNMGAVFTLKSWVTYG
jgi:hypothetical protein